MCKKVVRSGAKVSGSCGANILAYRSDAATAAGATCTTAETALAHRRNWVYAASSPRLQRFDHGVESAASCNYQYQFPPPTANTVDNGGACLETEFGVANNAAAKKTFSHRLQVQKFEQLQ